MKTISMALISALVFLILAPLALGEKFTIKNNKIFDQKGATWIFHGSNLVTKVPPYYQTGFGEQDLQKMQEMGLNGIRLGVMWPGVQPREDFFNQTYLDTMVNLVNMAGKYGIYTLVEFHQDLFSQKFCADGVPIWAIPKKIYHSFPKPLTRKSTQWNQTTGLPSGDTCGKFPWGQFYFTYAINEGFSHLWRNEDGLLDKFSNYWKKVAEAFRGNPYVIAYQLINEPWPGNLFHNPLVMAPGFSEVFNLQRAYDRLSHEIRSVDPDHNICFEPVTWLNQFRSGFTHPPGGQKFTNSSIFCYHYYNPPTLDLDGFWNARIHDVKRLNVAGILSEFYIIGEEGKANSQIMDRCDEHSHSWFGWLWNTQQQIAKQVIRTYAERIGGEVISQKFSNKTKRYELQFYANRSAGATRIFIDKDVHYPNGMTFECHPSCKYTQISPKMYEIDSNNFSQGQRVIIVVE